VRLPAAQDSFDKFRPARDSSNLSGPPRQWIERGRKFGIENEGVLLRDVLIEWIKQRKVVP